MVVLTKPSARKAVAARSTPKVSEEDTTSKLVYLPDVAAGRESTHPDTAPMTPVKRVLQTYELCEMVLDCLPLLDLYAKRICRSVKNTIVSSSKLQIKLFLRPASSKDCKPWLLTTNGHLTAGERAITGPLDASSSVMTPKPLAFDIYALNPLILHANPVGTPWGVVIPAQHRAHCSARNAAYKASGSSMQIFVSADCYYINDKAGSFKLSTHASCRAMYLSQPPAKEVTLELRAEPRDYEDRKTGRNVHYWHTGRKATWVFRNHSGVTFGQVIDRVHSETAQYGRRFGNVRFEIFDCRLVQDSMVVSLEEKEWVEAQGDVTAGTDIFGKEYHKR
ncbi:hypothetical protein B0A55_02573 [Friedmanniomyces simplex]|uniref:Uncharacterized protein n=1 Tax=Friedmanniomyces simplex TaxID=329884 RepID=A0A4U0XP34_9PEZI|nr:hypothetical protein B0A55_02573 [Friedmanniomyces simplex]